MDSFELTQLPSAEDDEYEFKSSLTNPSDLNKKLDHAASAFGNTGGGYFIAGVDGTGNADGGFPLKVGNQDVREWVDQVIHKVEYAPPYEVKLIDDPKGRGTIAPGRVVIAVRFLESFAGPHMASDKRYYIRAGAHAVSARHFLVEAIWARRHLAKPRLMHVATVKPHTTGSSLMVIELAPITDAPALDIEIDLDPRPEARRLTLPLRTTLIDQYHQYGFRFEFSVERYQSTLNVKYRDVAGTEYIYSAAIDSNESLPTYHRAPSDADRIIEAIKELKLR